MVGRSLWNWNRQCVENEILKEIPILKSIATLYHMVDRIKEKRLINLNYSWTYKNVQNHKSLYKFLWIYLYYSQKGQTIPIDINFIHLELSRYIKILFQLYRKPLNIFKCHIKLFFIWTVTAQFECNISCWMNCPCGNLYQLYTYGICLQFSHICRKNQTSEPIK